MHQVVVAAEVLGLGAQHAVHERAQVAGQSRLVEPAVGTRRDVADGDSGRHLDLGRLLEGGGAGEDVDGDTASGQPFGDLDDVDVHAARVAGPGLVERGGVQTDGGDPAGPRRSDLTLRARSL
ncbi:hypothetical protein ABH917_004160 [Thermobifida halotolerans]